MARSLGTCSRLLLALLLTALAGPATPAQAPAEVQGVGWPDRTTLGWSIGADAERYHVYRGRLDEIGAVPARCHGFDVTGTSFTTPEVPAAASGYFYLVTAESAAGGEGTPGSGGGGERALLGDCPTVMQSHVLNRLGYGWSEWSRDRVAALGGLGAYIDEQLVPASIDESTNTELNDRLGPWDPPTDIFQLIGRRVVSAVYARRQLEQQSAAFWANHFNTWWQKFADIFVGVYPQCNDIGDPPQCDPNFPAVAYRETTLALHRELEEFRFLAFNGNFREMLEASAFSAAMILYLDAYTSVVGNPNENYPRELMELHSMGVGGGYTQTDVEELARVFTGLTICKKKLNLVDDPLAPCIENYWESIPPGEWAALFYTPNHDCTQKTLFQGTAQETVIPDTCGNPDDGFNDIGLALDAIAAHPSTAQFISRKLLERFVTDEPDPSMIDALVTVWNNGTNPHGVGDLPAVLSAALHLPEFLDPDRTRTKIKTPLEHFSSALRSTRGTTDGRTTVLDFLILAQHIPHYNAVPTGFPESGGFWVDTTNTLERQNFGQFLAFFDTPQFGSDPISLLNDNGVSTGPANAEAIVDYLVDALFGGAVTPVERQTAVDFLNTDENGIPAPYDDARIRDTVAFMLGYAQFQEQ